MRFTPGSTAPLTVTVTDDHGALVDADSITADIFDPDSLKVDDGVPARMSQGTYEFDYLVPTDAIFGLWRADWTVNLAGHIIPGTEVFEVVDAATVGTVNPAVLQSHLRARLGEPKIDPLGNGSETFFTDAALQEVLTYADDDLDVATLEGWKRKSARYARLVDISESGSERKLSQRFRQADRMVGVWSKIVGEVAGVRSKALAGRVVGKVASLRCEDDTGLLGFFLGEAAGYTRMYPTHRFIMAAIL